MDSLRASGNTPNSKELLIICTRGFTKTAVSEIFIDAVCVCKLLIVTSWSCTLCALQQGNYKRICNKNRIPMQIPHFILNNHLSKLFGNFVWCNCIDNISSGILLVIWVFQVSSHSSRLSQMNSPSKLLLKFHFRLFNWMRSIYIFTQFKL